MGFAQAFRSVAHKGVPGLWGDNPAWAGDHRSPLREGGAWCGEDRTGRRVYSAEACAGGDGTPPLQGEWAGMKNRPMMEWRDGVYGNPRPTGDTLTDG
jgi:hypothetical protein